MDKIFGMKRFVFVLASIFLLNFAVFSQDNQTDRLIEDLIEDIAAQSDEELDFSTIYDDLHYYLENPLNLNTATRGQLRRLHFLNDVQIDAILNYREKYGDFQTIYELQLLDDFSQEDIDRLLHFVYVAPPKQQSDSLLFKRALKYGRHEVFMRTKFILQPQKGYHIPDSVLAENPDKAHYLGSPLKYYLRYKFHYRDRIQWGFTAEKDAGEQFFRGAQKYGFDYYSAHFQIDRVWKFKRIVVGDYQLQFGEGLVLWTGISFGKSAFVLNVKKKPQGIRKYSSTDENRFMRGIAFTLKQNRLEFSSFFSYHKVDGNVSLIDTADDEQDIIQITSLQTTGYHRTPSEIADKHTVAQMLWGSNLTYRGRNFKTGLTFVDYKIDALLIKDPKPYQIYDFQGNKNFNVGWNFTTSYKSLILFGEAAISRNGGKALITGLLAPLAPRLSMVALYRNYSPDYQAYFSNAFSEGTKNNNEKGFYLGMELLPYQRFKLSSYIDLYQFPWLKFRINSPMTYGADFLSQLDYTPNRNVQMYLRFKREIKEQNITQDAFVKYPVNILKWNLRYHVSFRLTEALTLRNRLEISHFEKDGEKNVYGFMAYQDIRYRPSFAPLTLYFRYAVFDAPYDARIYAYENDVLYAFSVPGYFYQGFRTYVVAKYDFTRRITFWFKYAQTTYTDRDKISEGTLNEIDGNTKSEVKFQVRIKF